jgi:AraC-like DNA-binding protein
MTLFDGVAAVRAWKPAVPGIREVLHARFADHAYPPHTHDAWTLFVVDDGAVRYDLDGRARSATPASVSVLPPWVTHDGRPATSGGYRKRVLYVEPDVLGESRIGHAVDSPMLPDPGLWRAVDRLHASLESLDDAIEAETRFAFVVERVRATLSAGPGAAPATAELPRDLAEALRAWLDARLTESVTLADAATDLHASVTVLARAFARDFGIPPHAYVIGRRLDLARDRILDGEPLAVVAADLGFADQAHLTRAFKRFLGTTPGRFGDRGPADRRGASIRADR